MQTDEKGRIIAVCTSKTKGTVKHDVGEGLLIEELGIEGDAHSGFAHRQISLISIEDIDTMRAKLPDLK
ncbi:MAG: MOSC domain-containing protein, partial [Synergistaceae bacterium]|nr:MOSC domain-containing protein [Synergistaceae bacterium]